MLLTVMTSGWIPHSGCISLSPGKAGSKGGTTKTLLVRLGKCQVFGGRLDHGGSG